MLKGPGNRLIDCGNPVARDHPLNRGLVAWWYGLPTNTGGKTLHDLLGQYTLSNTGSAAIRWGGNRGHGIAHMHTSGNARFQVSSTPVTTFPFSIAGWFCSNSNFVGTIAQVGTAGAADQSRFMLQAGGTSVPARAVISDSAGSLTNANVGTADYSGGQWTHAVAVFASATSMSVYLNGGGKVTTTTATSPSAAAVINVGVTQTTTGVYGGAIDGYIADISLWNRALLDTEVAAIYVEGVADNPTRLRRYTPTVWTFGTSSTAGKPIFSGGIFRSPIIAGTGGGIVA